MRKLLVFSLLAVLALALAACAAPAAQPAAPAQPTAAAAQPTAAPAQPTAAPAQPTTAAEPVTLTIESWRNDDLKLWQLRPFPRDRPDCARDQLRVNLPFRQLRQNLVKLAIADERLTADNRHVERTMAIDEGHEARDQLVALVVGEAAQRHATAKVIVAVGVTSGTTQRTFARDLDRDVRAVARKDAAPSLDDFSSANAHSITISPVILSKDARRNGIS